MLKLSNPWMKLFVQSDKNKYEVKAICTSAGEANVIMGLNSNLAVICEDEKGNIYLTETKPVVE